SFPYGLGVDAQGNILVADWGSAQVLAFDQLGQQLGTIPWDFGSTTPYFNQPWSIAFTPGAFLHDGVPTSEIIILDSGNNRVLRFGTDGQFIGAFGGFGIPSLSDPA